MAGNLKKVFKSDRVYIHSAGVTYHHRTKNNSVSHIYHPGIILDSSWIHPGFILDSSWIHPGFILDTDVRVATVLLLTLALLIN